MKVASVYLALFVTKVMKMLYKPFILQNSVHVQNYFVLLLRFYNFFQNCEKSSDNKVIDVADINLVIESWINDIKQSIINNKKFSNLKKQIFILTNAIYCAAEIGKSRYSK